MLIANQVRERGFSSRGWTSVKVELRHAPSIVPSDRLDRGIYLVLEDFGARAGCAWRETDEADADRETVLRDIIAGQYLYPLRIVAFNPIGLATPPPTSPASLLNG